ncbi:hypothetical protein Mx9_p21 [Myxococcus phage Mx9]|nr:hypothetical protein Mx9_p21 [Myxococcus phage Mx9]
MERYVKMRDKFRADLEFYKLLDTTESRNFEGFQDAWLASIQAAQKSLNSYLKTAKDAGFSRSQDDASDSSRSSEEVPSTRRLLEDMAAEGRRVWEEEKSNRNK